MKIAVALSLSSSMLILGACSTDQPKAGASLDAGAPAVADAGAPAAAAADTPALPAPIAVDAGPTAAAIHDAGPAAGAQAASATGTRPDSHTDNNLGAIQTSAFDRILAKPVDPKADAETLKALVEKKTGQQVTLVRRTAGKWFMFQFEPVPGGRSAEDQKKLVDKMKSISELASVEADRMMKVKMP